MELVWYLTGFASCLILVWLNKPDRDDGEQDRPYPFGNEPFI